MSPALGPHPVVVVMVVGVLMVLVLVLGHPTEVVLDHGGHVALNPGHQVLHLCKAAVNDRVNNCFVTVMRWMVNIHMFCFPCICIAVQSRKARCKCNNYYSHDTYALCIALRYWNRSIGLSTKTGCERRTPDLFTLV